MEGKLSRLLRKYAKLQLLFANVLQFYNIAKNSLFKVKAKLTLLLEKDLRYITIFMFIGKSILLVLKSFAIIGISS